MTDVLSRTTTPGFRSTAQRQQQQQQQMQQTSERSRLTSSKTATLNATLNSTTTTSSSNNSTTTATALAILQPPRKKLTTVEAERVVAVLDAAILKLEILNIATSQNSYFTLEKAKSCLNSEDVKMIEQLRNLESAFEYSKDSISTATNLKIQLQDLSRTLFRTANGNPALQSTLLSQPHCATLSVLIEQMKLLRSLLFDSLLLTVAEDRSRKEYISQLAIRSFKTDAEIAKLTEEINQLSANRNCVISDKDSLIQRLETQLETISSQSLDFCRRVESSTVRKETAEQTSVDNLKTEFNEQANKLQKELNDLRTKHRESESHLQKKKFKIESEVENWISKFDTDMEDKQTEIDHIAAQLSQEQSQLNELQNRFNELEIEYNIIMEERRLERERRLAAEEEMQKLIRAALLVQSFWRAYKCRKALKKQQKKGSGKPKKKKE